MKKVLALMLCAAVCFLFSACDIVEDVSELLREFSRVESLPEHDRAAESNAASSAAPDISRLPLREVDLEMRNAQVLDTDPIRFTEILGSRKRYPDSLPAIVGFQYPYVFYERMTVVVENAAPDDAALYVGRYSLETKEAQEFPIDRFTGISNEARLVVDEDRLVYMYCRLDEQGDLKMNIELFDYRDDTRTVIAAYSAYNVFGYAKKLSDRELVFFLYEKVADGTQQIVLCYDLQTEALREIYRGQTMGGYHSSSSSAEEVITVGMNGLSSSTKDIWAIDTGSGNIDLLMQQMVNGRMVSCLRTIDAQGNTVREEELTALSEFDSIEDTADSLVVKGDYAFVHYSTLDISERVEAPFAVLRKGNTGYRRLKIDDDAMAKSLCGAGSSELPYVFFQLHESDDTLLAVNVDTDKGVLLELPGDDIQNMMLDPAGNLLMAFRANEKTNWYLFPAEYVLEQLK